MVKYFCDLCGKQVRTSGDLDIIAVQDVLPKNCSKVYACPQCRTKFRELMRNMPVFAPCSFRWEIYEDKTPLFEESEDGE